MTEPILEVDDVAVRFGLRGGASLTAVDGVSLALRRGELLGLVGESGCGKSTLARAIVGLEPTVRGRIRLAGQDLGTLRGAELRHARKRVQLVFQDPESSLSPRMTIGQTLDEPLRIQGVSDRVARARRVRELLDLVALPSHFADRAPGALSGGQRQRVGIARALASEPEVLVCDEPVSALDVSIRAQIMNVLLDLRDELGLACLFIAHDLGLVHQACDRIAVMYLGRVVETGESDVVWRSPRHPYTHALLSAVPDADPDVERERRRIVLEGEVPSPIEPPSGCRFHTRCPIATERCRRDDPALAPHEGRDVACHHAGRSLEQLAAGAS